MNTKIALLLSGVITLCAISGKDVFYVILLVLVPITTFVALWCGPEHAKEFKNKIVAILKDHYCRKR